MGNINYLPMLEDVNQPLSDQQLLILKQQVDSELPEPTIGSQFNFAWGLLKSNDQSNNKQGINILTDIYKSVPQRRRECLYYLSVGCFKIGEYELSKKYVETLLVHEPNNLQALNLKKLIEDKLTKDGFIGLAIVSGALAVGIAGLSTYLKHNSKINRR